MAAHFVHIQRSTEFIAPRCRTEKCSGSDLPELRTLGIEDPDRADTYHLKFHDLGCDWASRPTDDVLARRLGSTLVGKETWARVGRQDLVSGIRFLSPITDKFDSPVAR
jgi:hypothetical protein